MKIAIIGAGALGLVFGGLLSTNNDVFLFDVSLEMVNKINNEGVIIEDEKNKTSTTYYPKAYLNGTYNDKMDLVMILVKSNYTRNSIMANINLFNKDTFVLTLQNGLGNDEKISEFVDKNHLILGVTRINSKRLSLNSAKRMNHGMSVFGYNDFSYDFVLKLVEEFNKSNLDASSDNNIKHLIWDKLFLNLCCNPYCAYFDCSMSNLVKDEKKWRHIEKTLTEAVNVANALGLNFDKDKIIQTEKEFCEAVDGFPSMYQDVKNKRITEIDAMNGIIASLGEKLNIDVSENKWISKQIHLIEKNYN